MDEQKYLSFIYQTLGSHQNITLSPLAGDASTRRYYRITDNVNSWVLMDMEPFDLNELPFSNIEEHFRLNGINVPQIYSLRPEDGLLLIEDLGDLTLERKFWENLDQNEIIPFYQLALDELLKIHYTATENKRTCIAFNVNFDKEKFMWEMNYGKQQLIERLCLIDSTPFSDHLNKIFNSICSRLDQEPKFLCHRDYHSRNLMLKLNKMYVIDFQDARMGPIQYDLVSLLRDSYVDLKDDIFDNLLNYYNENQPSFQKSSSLFYEVFELQTIQRCFKACGSFASFYNLRQDTRYLKYLNKTLRTVIKSLDAFPEYRLFSDILLDYGLLEKNYEAIKSS